MSENEKNELAKADTPPIVLEAEVVPPKIKKKRIGGIESNKGIEDPRRIIRHGLIVIALFFGVLGVWSIFAKISGAVVAPGKVKIESERKTVQHLEGGIVESILVGEGDEVTAGQTLIILESIQVEASVEMLRKQLTSFTAAQIRYTAEKELKTTVVWPEELKKLAEAANAQDILANEEKIFIARREAIQGQISMLKSQIAQTESQITGLEEQFRAEQSIVATLEEELVAKRQLVEERYLEKSHGRLPGSTGT